MKRNDQTLQKLYQKFNIRCLEDGETAHQMELARRRYKAHKSNKSKTTTPKR